MRPHRTSPHPTYCLLSLGAMPAGRTALDRRSGRLGGAIGTAAATHAALLLLGWGVASLRPADDRAARATGPTLPPLVYAAPTGPGLGRDGGGNHSPSPPARLRTRGADPIAAAAVSRPTLATPDTIAPERERLPALPVSPMNAGDFAQVGAVNGLPGPPTPALGPDDAGSGTAPGPGRGHGDQPGDGQGDVYGPGNGVTAPQLLTRTAPQYTPEAMRAKIQGVALLSGVVGADGTLRDIRVVRSLDGTFGLDQEAIRCVRQWTFRPGTRLGRPVAVAVTFEVAFNLR